MFYSTGSVIARYHRLDGIICWVVSKVQVLAELVSAKACLRGSQIAVFLLFLLVVLMSWSLCVPVSLHKDDRLD